jgi:hypothetical protein
VEIRTRLTGVIVGAVAALLFFAGVDALRASDSDGAASAPATVVTTRPTSRIFSVNLSRTHGSQIAVEFESVWNVPYGFRGGKPERLRNGKGEATRSRQ